MAPQTCKLGRPCYALCLLPLVILTTRVSFRGDSPLPDCWVNVQRNHRRRSVQHGSQGCALPRRLRPFVGRGGAFTRPFRIAASSFASTPRNSGAASERPSLDAEASPSSSSDLKLQLLGQPETQVASLSTSITTSNATSWADGRTQRGWQISGIPLSQRQKLAERLDATQKAANSRREFGVAGLSGLIGFGLAKQSGLSGASVAEGFKPGQVISEGDDIVTMLQGEWEDEIDITIRISGRQASFTDDPWNTYPIEEGSNGELSLRGARLVSLGDNPKIPAPVWRFPSGTQHQWERLTKRALGDDPWDEVFREYKGERLEIWEALCAAEGSERRRLEEKWRDGGPLPLSPLALFWRSRLLAGQNIVPGVCFLHRKFGYRGVVVGHDSKCIARESWKAAMGVDELPGGEKQPFYQCIVDERDRPGDQLAYVAEANIMPEFSGRVFPLEADIAAASFIKWDSAFGYTPKPKLRAMLRRQRDTGGRFVF